MPRIRVVMVVWTIAACVIATPAVGGCTNHAASSHGSLTDGEFKAAVAIARANTTKFAATVTSATATVGAGTVTDPNAGPACTSGTVLNIKLIGTFPTIVADLAGGAAVTTVLITADAVSGKACDVAVQTGPTTPDPGSTLLFSH